MRPVAAGVKVGILVMALLLGSYTVWKSLGADPAGSPGSAAGPAGSPAAAAAGGVQQGSVHRVLRLG